MRSLTVDGGGGSPSPISGVGDKAAGSGTEMDVLHGKWLIDVHGGDPKGPTGNFAKSTEVAKAIIAALH